MAKKTAVQPASIPEVQSAPPPAVPQQAMEQPWPAPPPNLGILIWESVAEVVAQGKPFQYSIVGLARNYQDAFDGAAKTFRGIFGVVPFEIIKHGRILNPAFINLPQE